MKAMEYSLKKKKKQLEGSLKVTSETEAVALDYKRWVIYEQSP